MKIYDKRGMLIIPELERLKKLSTGYGVLRRKKRILIKQLYCENGHPLISPSNPRFDDEPGIHLTCEGEYYRQSVYLSPFQNDDRKKYRKAYKDGELLLLFCPVCETEFPVMASHDCRPGAMFHLLFLDKEANSHNAVCICNAWGCYASRLILSGEILSEVQLHAVLH